MKFTEKIESYFNSGSTDKQNKRRLGGLLIGVTAILLVLAIFLTAISGVVALIKNIDFGGNGGDEDDESTTNSHLVEVAEADVTGSSKATSILLDGSVPAGMTVSPFREFQFRPKKANGEAIYKSNNTQGLQTEALEAFNKMISDFHTATNDKVVLWLEEAYETKEGAVNGTYYANALAVEIQYEHLGEDGTTKLYDPIHGSTECEWITENAYKYGFVRVSNAEGEDSIYRYVGLAHAKYIYDKQRKSDDTFYSLDSYLTDIKAATPDNKITLKGATSLADDSNTTYYVYSMTVAEGAVYKLPSAKYDYNIMATADGYYIVTYWKATNK